MIWLLIDEVVILERSEGYIKGTLEEMAATTHQIGLQINDTKTSTFYKGQMKMKIM
jgi:hypothetical protein